MMRIKNKLILLLFFAFVCSTSTAQISFKKTYSGTKASKGNAIIQTNDGGFLIAGNSRSSDQDLTDNIGENDMWILKTNVNGDLEWQTSLGGAGLDFGFDAMEKGENEIIFVGQSGSADFNSESHQGDTDLVMIKFR